MRTTNINENEQSSKSQCKMIASYLEEGGKLTQMDALRLFGCFRLASRISELRARGMKISKRMITTESGRRVAEYSRVEDYAIAY